MEIKEVVCNPLVIAIDYDMCISRAPNEFTRIMMLMKSMQWTILAVTDRNFDSGAMEMKWLGEVTDQIIYCGGIAKIDVLEDMGIDPDIWIDDDPLTIIDGVTKSVH